MKVKLILPLCLGLVLAGCSSQRNVAEGSFDYLKLSQEKPVESTGDLELQNASNKYSIPTIAESRGQAALGTEVNIRPPLQVIAAAPGSRIEENQQESKLYFDATDNIPHLQARIWQHVLETVTALKVPFEQDEATGLIRTERFRHVILSERRSGMRHLLTRSRVETESEQQLELRLTMAGHGRSGELEVKVIEPTYFYDGQAEKLPMNFTRNFEAQILNDVSMAMERGVRTERVILAQEKIEMRLGETEHGNPAFVIQADFNTIWSLLPGVFQQLNFVIDDLNQSEGMYYVSYEPFGKRRWYHALAFWKKKQVGELDLATGTELTFGVDEVEETIYLIPRIAGETLSQETLAEWLPKFAAALTKQQ